MALRPRPDDTAQPTSRRRHAVHHDGGVADDDGLSGWGREGRRVLREFEEIRAHCRRQLEIITAQREFLRDLNPHRAFEAGKAPAREDSGAGRAHEEETGAGE